MGHGSCDSTDAVEKRRKKAEYDKQCNLKRKNPNHTSLIKNYVVPCICLMDVMTYACFHVTRNAGIRKANLATRYVGPCMS